MNWFREFIGVEINVNETLAYIKNNISFIVIIPSVLGGLGQLLRLFLIEPEMIRFFSVSQVVPDGLAIILITAILSFFYYFIVRLYYLLLLFFEKFRFRGISYFFASLSFVLIVIIGENYFFQNYILTDSYEKKGVYYYLIILFCIITSLPFLFLSILFLSSFNRTRVDFHHFFKDKSIIKLSCLIILVTMFTIPPIYSNDYITNFSSLERDLQHKHSTLERVEIRFLNDRYVIVELKSDQPAHTHLHPLFKIYLLNDVIRGEFN